MGDFYIKSIRSCQRDDLYQKTQMFHHIGYYLTKGERSNPRSLIFRLDPIYSNYEDTPFAYLMGETWYISSVMTQGI